MLQRALRTASLASRVLVKMSQHIASGLFSRTFQRFYLNNIWNVSAALQVVVKYILESYCVINRTLLAIVEL